jgi:hypothetical protein
MSLGVKGLNSDVLRHVPPLKLGHRMIGVSIRLFRHARYGASTFSYTLTNTPVWWRLTSRTSVRTATVLPQRLPFIMKSYKQSLQSHCFMVTTEFWLRGELGRTHSHTIFTKANFYHHVLFQYLRAKAFFASQVRVFAMLSLQTIKKLDTDGAGMSSNR